MTEASTSHIIDSHLHLWDLTHSDYSWNVPALEALHRNVLPDEAAGELTAAGVGGAILVQAEDSLVDTGWLLDLTAAHPWVAGVVGWLPLDSPAETAASLDELTDPALVGIRHLVHDDPRADFLDLPDVRRSLALVAERGLSLDVPDAWPRHLGQVASLADDLPDLQIVVDHLAKPPHGRDDFAAWESTLRDVAARPNVVAKLSGLQSPEAPFTVDALRPAVDVALDAFGPQRLMFGSDWPMPTQTGLTYSDVIATTAALLEPLSLGEREAIWSGTALETYQVRQPHRDDAIGSVSP